MVDLTLESNTPLPENRDFSSFNLLEKITHPPAKAVPLFLEGNLSESPLEGGIKRGCDQTLKVKGRESNVEGQESQKSKIGISLPLNVKKNWTRLELSFGFPFSQVY